MLEKVRHSSQKLYAHLDQLVQLGVIPPLHTLLKPLFPPFPAHCLLKLLGALLNKVQHDQMHRILTGLLLFGCPRVLAHVSFTRRPRGRVREPQASLEPRRVLLQAQQKTFVVDGGWFVFGDAPRQPCRVGLFRWHHARLVDHFKFLKGNGYDLNTSAAFHNT